MKAKPKRIRRTNSELHQILEAAITCLGEYAERITIRHLFYRLSNDYKIIPKTESSYNTLKNHLAKWRRSEKIPMGAFIDSSRWHYGKDTYSNAVAGMIDLARRNYRLNLWEFTDRYVEIWVEKDAMASIICPVADEWNLKTFVCRGDASISSLYDAACTFRAAAKDGKTPTIIYLGDYDQTGMDIPRVIERNLIKDHGAEVELMRVAINEWQIEAWNLPTRPPKITKRGPVLKHAVEVDVLKPGKIRELIISSIHSLVDPAQLEALKLIEEAEIEVTEKILLSDGYVQAIQDAHDVGGSRHP